MDTSPATAQAHLRKAIDDQIRELNHRRNALVPISRLPPETLAEIFSLVSFSVDDYEDVPDMKWIRVTHVCRRWREIALSFPYLWSHIPFTKLTLAGFTEILARAKMSPLHFNVGIFPGYKARFDGFGRQLEAHISHIRHLTISGDYPTELEPLVSPAPALVSLSLTKISDPIWSQCTIPDSLFNGTAPKLTHLELFNCSIGWKSPLLKGLQILKIQAPSEQLRPTLEDWLAALNEMSQLKTLLLHNATPAVSVDNPLISGPQCTVTLPSLTHFHITASAKGCALALAHLVLPALISLHVRPASQSWEGDDIQLLIPYVARNAHGQQDTAPLQTIVFSGEATYADFVAWTVPDTDVEVCDIDTMFKAKASARLVLSVIPDSEWRNGTDTVIFDTVLSHLPLNAISTLSALNNTRLSKEVWLSHASRLTMLKRATLVPTAVRAFRKMLEEDVPPNGLPRLPQLTTLVLSKVALTAPRTYHLRDMLVKRREHGVPLDVLDLRTCIGTERAIQLLSETVGDVQGPAESLTVGRSAFFNWERRLGPSDEEERTDDDEYDDGPGPWYGPEGDFEIEEDEDEFDDFDDE